MIEYSGSDDLDIGRWAYLRAMNKHWPEPLETLLRDIFPIYVPPFATDPDSVNRSPITDDWSRIDSDQSLRELRDRFMVWGDAFRVRDKWLFDAALHTLNQNYKVKLYPRLAFVAGAVGVWMYVEPSHITFVPHMPPQSWLPIQYGSPDTWETWAKFSFRITSEIRSQLAEYHQAINRRYGDGPPEMNRDARWTVLFQKGHSFSSVSVRPRPS
jgi:hypothetical protein